MPEISVIVPNFNHSRYLKQRIDSILCQTYQDFELILLDDHSTDNSREILETYRTNPHVTNVIFNEKNSGSTFVQWDRGINVAKGKWIWIAESDDWAEPHFLETMMKNILNHPNCGLIYCASRLIDEKGSVTFENEQDVMDVPKVWDGREYINCILAYSNQIWNASMMMFRKDCYPQIQYRSLFEKMKYCGDWMFYVLVAMNSSVIHIPIVLNNFRQHDGNVSRKSERNGLSCIEGLDVLKFMLPLLNNKLKVKVFWCKNICRSIKRNDFSEVLIRRIIEKIRQTSFLMLLMFRGIFLIYKYK